MHCHFFVNDEIDTRSFQYRYKNQGKHNGHGPHDASKEKFVSMVSFARSMSQVMAAVDRPHSPETNRQRWERDYEERMRRLENDLNRTEQNKLWSARGGNKRGKSLHVRRQYQEAKAAFKGIHRLSSLAFMPIQPAAESESSVDTTTVVDTTCTVQQTKYSKSVDAGYGSVNNGSES